MASSAVFRQCGMSRSSGLARAKRGSNKSKPAKKRSASAKRSTAKKASPKKKTTAKKSTAKKAPKKVAKKKTASKGRKTAARPAKAAQTTETQEEFKPVHREMEEGPDMRRRGAAEPVEIEDEMEDELGDGMALEEDEETANDFLDKPEDLSHDEDTE